MLTHGPSCLQGPITKQRAWWRAMARREAVPLRLALVERVRREIADGTYDTPERFDAALDRLMTQIEGE